MSAHHVYGGRAFSSWFAWRPVRDIDGNWCWWKYLMKRRDGYKRFPDDVDT